MKKVLIVDDEPNIVMSLDYAFQKKGYEVFIARNGVEAINLAVKQLPHVILMDIMMPDIDGYETFERLKQVEKLKDTKLIFLSAKNKKEDIHKGLEMGAKAYLTKPFSIRKLMQIIEK